MSGGDCPFFETKCKREECALFLVEDYNEAEGSIGQCAIRKIAVELERHSEMTLSPKQEEGAVR